MYKGLFISFEGIDGTGKSTQVKLLAKHLESLGHALYITKEPGDAKSGSGVGIGVRSLLFGTPGTKNLGPGVGDLLFLADHLQNTHDIRAALQKGKIVLCDRYADSQFAYSASATKKAPKWANILFAEHFGPTPDMTVLFVVRGEIDYKHSNFEDISWALTRANARRGDEAGKQDGKAWNDVEEQRKIQDAYRFNLRPQNRTFLMNIWEHTTPEIIHDQILTEVLHRLAGQGSSPQLVLDIPEQQVA
jgi:dTMP kinase